MKRKFGRLYNQIEYRCDPFQGRTAFGERQQLIRKLRGVLCGLACATQDREQIRRIARGFDLGQTDVAGNNSQDVI